MGSSVDFCRVFGLRNHYCEQNGRTNYIPRNLIISGGYFRVESGRFLHCHLLQMVLVEVKTAGYQA